MQRHPVIALILIAIVFPSLMGCGRKGDPELPPGQTDHFKRQYPTTTDPQRGVFN